MLRALSESSRFGLVRASLLTSARVFLAAFRFLPRDRPRVEPHAMMVRHPVRRRDGVFAGRVFAVRVFAGRIVAWLEHQWGAP